MDASELQQHRHRLLADLSSLKMTCDGCGHVAVLGFAELRTVQEKGAHTVGDVVARGSCRLCRESSRPARRVSWEAKWHARVRALSGG